MKIGIDAKWYYEGPPSGMRVTKNLVDRVLAAKGRHEIVLFLNARQEEQAMALKLQAKLDSGITLVFLPGRINFLTNLLIFPLYAFRHRCDVIVFQNYVPLWRILGSKTVAFVHDVIFLEHPEYFRKRERIVYRQMLGSINRADSVITISASERRRILRHSNKNAAAIDYIHWAPDDIFKPLPQKEQESVKSRMKLPDKYILYVGRINARKNLEILLSSVSMIANETSLVVVGDPDGQSQDIVNAIDVQRRRGNLLWLRNVGNEDLAGIFASAFIFVFPSLAEGFGIPPLEAMKCGIPTLVSDIEVHREIYGNGAGYFFPKDCAALASKIDELSTDRNAYHLLRDRGMERAAQFSWSKTAARFLELVTTEAGS